MPPIRIIIKKAILIKLMKPVNDNLMKFMEASKIFEVLYFGVVG